MSLIRKVFAPTAIVLGMFLAMAAFGLGSDVKTAQAFAGDLCMIEGPTKISVGQTVIYVARVEDDDENDDYTVLLDDIVGNSDITSILEGDGDLDDYKKINPVDLIHDLEDVNAEWIDEDTIEFLETHFDYNFAADVCGDNSVRDELIQCVDTANCGTISTAIMNAVVAAVEAAIADGEVDDCDELGDVAEDAAIGAGAANALAGEIKDWIEDMCEDGDVFDDLLIIDVTCTAAGNFQLTFADDNETDNAISIQVTCVGAPNAGTITVSPAMVEIVPAMGNVSHSLITVTTTHSGTQAGAGFEVDFVTDRCSIETSGVDTAAEFMAARTIFNALNMNVPSTAAAIEASAAATSPVDSSRQADASMTFEVTGPSATVAAAILGCDPLDAPGATPGVANIRAIIEVAGGADIVLTATVTVVGPPASVTVAASPTSVRCGEKATITVTVKDAIGQNVSEHTRVEAVTNAGGVLGGTGAVAGLAGPVVPLSSTVSETFSGVATFFLLTSEQHSGPYEVVVSTGGAGSVTTSLGGVFSTAPQTAQATVTCSIPSTVVPQAQPTVAAPISGPRTGTGSVTPPNTGDAGLADSSGSSMALFAIGAVAFAFAGLATVKFARR